MQLCRRNLNNNKDSTRVCDASEGPFGWQSKKSVSMQTVYISSEHVYCNSEHVFSSLGGLQFEFFQWGLNAPIARLLQNEYEVFYHDLISAS